MRNIIFKLVKHIDIKNCDSFLDAVDKFHPSLIRLFIEEMYKSDEVNPSIFCHKKFKILDTRINK